SPLLPGAAATMSTLVRKPTRGMSRFSLFPGLPSERRSATMLSNSSADSFFIPGIIALDDLRPQTRTLPSARLERRCSLALGTLPAVLAAAGRRAGSDDSGLEPGCSCDDDGAPSGVGGRRRGCKGLRLGSIAAIISYRLHQRHAMSWIENRFEEGLI